MSTDSRIVMLTILVLGASPLGRAEAQELPLRLADGGVPCEEVERPGTQPSAEARAQVEELTSQAEASLIRGELERAEASLERAGELDPGSGTLAYRHGRVLEDLGRVEDAIRAYCHARALGGDDEVRDATPRLERLVTGLEGRVPEAAREANRRAVVAARDGDHHAALSELEQALAEAPDWAELAYNRGVVLSILGREDEAATELRRYLELDPRAPDAAAVSRRVGQLEAGSAARAATPSPAAAMVLGGLVPGLGQFYSGRAKAGLLVATLAGGTVAAGLLVTHTDVRCQVDVAADETCPGEAVVSRSEERPHLVQAIGVAAAVTLFGAVEAFLHARRDRSAPTPSDPSALQVEGPSIGVRGARLELGLVRIRFR